MTQWSRDHQLPGLVLQQHSGPVQQYRQRGHGVNRGPGSGHQNNTTQCRVGETRYPGLSSTADSLPAYGDKLAFIIR